MPRGRSSADDALVDPRTRPLAVIVSADCDLEWDYQRRRGLGSPDKELDTTILAEVFDAAYLWNRWSAEPPNARRRRLDDIDKHQEPRYHRMPSIPPLVTPSALPVELDTLWVEPKLFIDFKRVFALPTEEIYYQLRRGWAKRAGTLVPPFVHHMTQRCYDYLGRIGVDE